MKMSLLSAVRKFWYNNTPGVFRVGDYQITRKEIQTYGGPAPELYDCDVCQVSEWVSRTRQMLLYTSHSCATSGRCKYLCKRQDRERWTHYHQNFWFSVGVNPNLHAPKGILIAQPAGKQRYLSAHCCDHSIINLRRMFTQACQIEVVSTPMEIDWSRYDFAYIVNAGKKPFLSSRPTIPTILYGHDHWKRHADYQMVISRLQPDYFLTPYPQSWKALYQFPAHTKIRFQCLSPSNFFARPNLGRKKIDLLVIGSTTDDIYSPRKELNQQIKALGNQFHIQFHNTVGWYAATYNGPVSNTNAKINYLNAWSTQIATARYVIFGPIRAPMQVLFAKYYECVGSGAIPIMPYAPQLDVLGIEPMVHYIPLKEVWNKPDRLAWYLRHYQQFRTIAHNAVEWYQRNADRLLFDRFEDVIREVTKWEYPKRLI